MTFGMWGILVSIILFFMSFVLYPLLLFLTAYRYRNIKKSIINSNLPSESISFIIVVHNAENIITDKINNILQLDFCDLQYEIIIYLDGCADNTFEKVNTVLSDRIKVINESSHLGKISGLNTAASIAKGDILIFTDADALFEKKLLHKLLVHFNDSRCGGVCGLRVIRENQGKLRLAQHIYITFDSYIKSLESYLGNITSNDGKLYAIRRNLFRPIADAVTDDLYSCLNIAEQYYKFVFEPKAIAYISTPSRNIGHEIERRRRIVNRSLNGIFLKRHLLNPLNYGMFSIGLLINKVFRRLFGVLLLLIFISSYFASSYSELIAFILYVQFVFYLLAIIYPVILSKIDFLNNLQISRIASICWYFCLGNYATLLGVIDFLSGKRVSIWTPKKQD